jgi:hypothetical protein
MTFDYKRYLASREWAVKREAVRARAGGLCERCWLSPMQAVHHQTYARIGNESLEDLQAVCATCHEFLSAKAGRDPRDEWWAEFVSWFLAASMVPNPDDRPINRYNDDEWGAVRSLINSMKVEPPEPVLWSLLQSIATATVAA